MSDLSFWTGVSSLLTVEQHPPSLCSGRRKSQFHLQFPFQLFLCFTLVQMFSSVQSLSCVRLFATPWTKHARPPCLSPTPRVHPNPCPSSRWCHPTISSSVIPFSSCPQSFPASGYFQMSQLFESGGQSIGVSASTSVLPKNTQDWSPLG